MIIQIRGTSGSGKTTVMRRVMAATAWEPIVVEGRKQPLYYYAKGERTALSGVVVLGHYNSACGGCDTIGSARKVFELTSLVLDSGPVQVLQEGLLLSEDVKWTLQMPHPLVLFLNTPLETCLAQIGKRRAAAGNDEPVDPANTTNRVKTIERAKTKLEAAGVDCRWCSPAQAVRQILDLTRLHAGRRD